MLRSFYEQRQIKFITYMVDQGKFQNLNVNMDRYELITLLEQSTVHPNLKENLPFLPAPPRPPIPPMPPIPPIPPIEPKDENPPSSPKPPLPPPKNILKISEGSTLAPPELKPCIPPIPPIPAPGSPSYSICPESYNSFFFGSDRTPQASVIYLNFFQASVCSASDLFLFLSGWYFMARDLQAFLRSASEHPFWIPSIPQQSFFLEDLSSFWACLILSLMLVDGSSSCILLQSMVAAVYSARYIWTQARRAQDFTQFGSNSIDLLRSSRALSHSFLFIKVKALFEQTIALSFLLAGSRASDSVYFSAASAYLFYLINQLPCSLSCSLFLALFNASLHLLLSGSCLIPSWNIFLALALSPPYNSIMPLRQNPSGPATSTPLNKFLASSAFPVFANISTFISFSLSFSGILEIRQFTHMSASLYSSALTCSKYLLQFLSRFWQSSYQFFMVCSLSSVIAFLKLANASQKFSKFICASALRRKTLAKLGSRFSALSQSSMVLEQFLRLRQHAARFPKQLASLALRAIAFEQEAIASVQFLALK